MMPRLVILAVLGAAASAQAFAADCDRPCLTSLLNQYLSAVVNHDPAEARLSPGFRQTDNAVVVKLGTGVWKTVTGLGKVQRRYLDPVSGQAAYFGTVEEGDKQAIVTVRLRVEDNVITEAEWFLARDGDVGLNGPVQPGQPAGNFFDPDNLAMNPPPQRVVPQGQRLSRQALMGITNSYFDGITTHDGSIIRAHQGCTRLENGNTVTGRPGRGGGPPSDCTSGLANISVQLVAGRRYPVIDEEAGVVLALAVFIRKPGLATRRNAFSEWFVIDEGQIRTIYSAMFYPPPEAPVPNWPPYEGNWPIPASILPAQQ